MKNLLKKPELVWLGSFVCYALVCWLLFWWIGSLWHTANSDVVPPEPTTTTEVVVQAEPEVPDGEGQGTLEAKKKESSYEVLRIVDGDTIIVDFEGKDEKIRLAGIDAPELSQPYGQEAFDFLRDMVLGKKVTLQVLTRDVYDRIVAVVFLDGVDVNAVLTEEGLVWGYKVRQNVDYTAQEQFARENKRGVWSRASNLPPWLYRKLTSLGNYGKSLADDSFYMWNGIVHNSHCKKYKFDDRYLWDGTGHYENCPECGGVLVDDTTDK